MRRQNGYSFKLLTRKKKWQNRPNVFRRFVLCFYSDLCVCMLVCIIKVSKLTFSNHVDCLHYEKCFLKNDKTNLVFIQVVGTVLLIHCVGYIVALEERKNIVCM